MFRNIKNKKEKNHIIVSVLLSAIVLVYSTIEGAKRVDASNKTYLPYPSETRFDTLLDKAEEDYNKMFKKQK